MIIVPVSFNGTSLQSTDFTASYPDDNALLSPSTNPIYIKRAGAWPVLSGVEFNTNTIGIDVECLGDFMTTFETLVQVFNVEDETPRQFIIKDTTTTDEPQYSVYAVPKLIVGGNDGSMARITLALDNPIWSGVTQNSQTFLITSATDSTSVTNSGNADTYPIIEITPTSSSTDYAYGRHLQILPTSAKPWPNRFLDVCGTSDGTGLDTAALVAGSKMQADGDDLRLFRNEVELDRQLSGINTTDTHVICVTNFPPARDMTLKTAIASTDTVTEVELNYTTLNKKKITALASRGRLIIDSGLGTTDTEEFVYTAKTVTATKLAFTIGSRAARSTVAASHAVDSNVRFLPFAFTLVYGNPSVSAPVIDDTKKPIHALTSRNTSFVFSNFSDIAGLRAGIFNPIPAIVSNPLLSKSGTYTSTNDEGDTDPSSAIGMKALTYTRNGVVRPDAVILGWLNYFPDGISSISADGAQSQTRSRWPTLTLQTSSLPASTSFTSLWTIAAQSATDYSTFTTWSKASSDATIPANATYLRWYMEGTVSGLSTDYAKGEISSLTVGLSNPPHIMIRSEISNFSLNCRIRNETTGDFFVLNLPVELNETVYVDTDPDFPTVTYKGEVVNGAIQLSSTRSEWLKLSPGANTIGFEALSTSVSNLTVGIKHYTRKRFI